MTRNKKIIIGIVISVLFFTGVLIVWENYHKPIIKIEPPEGGDSSEWTPFGEEWQPMVEKIAFWQNGSEWIVSPENSEYLELGRILLSTLHKLNLQAKCVFSEKGIQEIKEKNRVVELVFKQAEDFLISQWVQEEERYHIPTDKKGYRNLENFKDAIFVLEDNLGEGMEGHILVGSERKDREEKMWGCWAIQQKVGQDLDKSWIGEIENQLIRLAKETKIENSARETIEKFMMARIYQRNQPFAESFLTENAKKQYSQSPLTLIGTSNPHFTRYEVLGTEKLNKEKFKFRVRIYEEYTGKGEVGYFDEFLIVVKKDDKYLIDSVKRSEYINF